MGYISQIASLTFSVVITGTSLLVYRPSGNLIGRLFEFPEMLFGSGWRQTLFACLIISGVWCWFEGRNSFELTPKFFAYGGFVIAGIGLWRVFVAPSRHCCHSPCLRHF